MSNCIACNAAPQIAVSVCVFRVPGSEAKIFKICATPRYIFLLDHPKPLLDHLGGSKTALARPLVHSNKVC